MTFTGATNLTDANTPWYRQFWPWFILSPLILVIMAGFWMIYIATVTSTGVVVDNFYKDGLSIVERTEQDEWAARRNLTAQLQSIGDRVQLRLGGELDNPPQALSLLFVFSTQASRDVRVRLERSADGRYTGRLPESIEGTRQLLLEPVNSDQAWRLHGDMRLPSSSIVSLQPRVE